MDKILSVSVKLEWPTLGLIFTCYTLWLGAGFWLSNYSYSLSFTVMAILAAFHSSLSHEAVHGHPFQKPWLNEALVFLPLSLFYPYRRYANTHRLHHRDARITDPFDDPESYYLTRCNYEQMPPYQRNLFRINNSLLGRITIGPWLMLITFFISEFRLIRVNAKGIRLSWLLHLLGAGIVVFLISLMGIPLWLYALTVCWPAFSIISIRSFAEHRWHETPSGRTIIVERSPLSLLFLNNNLHLVHHNHPQAPWYELPKLYWESRDYWHQQNGAYVFENYFALWRLWGIKPKEPVIHPAYKD